MGKILKPLNRSQKQAAEPQAAFTHLLGERLWLFLDYDGTLADFAPNPDIVQPEPELITLIARLAAFPDRLRLTVLSGRRLAHIAQLLPVPGILLAGSYGIEFTTWDGESVHLVNYESGRPLLDQIKTRWTALIEHLIGFYLEDKGYSLALHGRFAREQEARVVLDTARRIASETADSGIFQILGGNQFLEVAPTIADKGQSVITLINRFPWPGVRLVYIGDDDKDEAAFRAIKQLGGKAIVVAESARLTAAEERLPNPQAVRDWLRSLAESLEENSPDYSRQRTD